MGPGIRKGLYWLTVLACACCLAGAEANACDFNSVGDFVCPKEKAKTFAPPPSPFKRAPASKPPIYAPPVPLPTPQKDKHLALAACFKDSIADAEGGKFGTGECGEARACLIDKGFEPGFTCGFPSCGSADVGKPMSICVGTPSRTVNVSSNGELSAALANAQCGDEIVATGSFSGNFTLNKNCSEGSPILVRSGGGASFSNASFSLDGSYGILSGMNFNNGHVGISGDSNRVAGNVFQNGGNIAVQITKGGSFNRIDHNEITGQSTYGIQVKLSGGDPVAQGNLIDGNYIHDFDNIRKNGGEAIQVGQGLGSTNWNTGTVIKGNLIRNVSIDSEIVSVKSSGATIIGNTFLDSKAALSLRHGTNNTIQNNFVSGLAGGVKVHGDNHKVIGNVVNGTINIMGGDATQDMLAGIKDETGKGGHPAARDALVSGNKASTIRVGYTFDTYGTGLTGAYPASNTSLVGNQANVQLLKQTGTKQSDGPLLTDGVRQLTPGEVGPAAVSTSCTGEEGGEDIAGSGATGGASGCGGTTPSPGFDEIASCGAEQSVSGSSLSSALGGGGCKTLVLAPGRYPAINISGHSGGVLTLRCAVPQACDFDRINIVNSTGVIIDGASVTGGNLGIGIENSKNVLIKNGLFKEQTMTGILVTGEQSANIQLHGNTFYNYLSTRIVSDGFPDGSMDYGIRLYDAQSVDIKGNVFEGLFNHTISLKGGVDYTAITENKFIDCGRICINTGQVPRCTGKSKINDNVVISNNVFTKVRRRSIGVLNSASNTITGNQFDGRGNLYDALYFEGDEPGCVGSLVNRGVPDNRGINASGNTVH